LPNHRARVAAGCVVVVGMVGGAAPAAVAQPAIAPSAAHTKVVANCENPQSRPTYRPDRIVAACGGDAVFILRHIRYRHWSRHRAIARAVVRYNSCIPDCVSGNLVDSHATFSLVRPRIHHGRRLFTVVVVHSRRGPSGRYPLGG
jgi:hypothetical protein